MSFKNGLRTQCCVCGDELLIPREDRIEFGDGLECAYTCKSCDEKIAAACAWCGGSGHSIEDCEQFINAWERD